VAEASFQKVLTKYPVRRGVYGMDWGAPGSRCGKGQAGIRAPDRREHAGDQIHVLAWSHRLPRTDFDDEGNLEVAKMEYQSVLSVEGGPEQANWRRKKASGGLAEINDSAALNRRRFEL